MKLITARIRWLLQTDRCSQPPVPILSIESVSALINVFVFTILPHTDRNKKLYICNFKCPSSPSLPLPVLLPMLFLVFQCVPDSIVPLWSTRCPQCAPSSCRAQLRPISQPWSVLPAAPCQQLLSQWPCRQAFLWPSFYSNISVLGNEWGIHKDINLERSSYFWCATNARVKLVWNLQILTHHLNIIISSVITCECQCLFSVYFYSHTVNTGQITITLVILMICLSPQLCPTLFVTGFFFLMMHFNQHHRHVFF